MSETESRAEFPATKWSIIQKVAATHSPTSCKALEDLCRTYWPPLYAFLRRSGHPPHEAKDLVQGYIARLLERGDLGTLSPEKGRFRSYLLSGLRNHLVSQARREAAQRRGGTVEVFSFDADKAESIFQAASGEALAPDRAFDRRWAETVLDRALELLRQEQVDRGKEKLYDSLKLALAGDSKDGYSDLGRQVGMTPGAVAVAVHRLRMRLRELVRSEVAQTVGSQSELEEEMRNLLAILSQ